MRLLLMSDTHAPTRARSLPAAVLTAVDEADAVLHAGDWVDEAALNVLVFGHSHIPWDTTVGSLRLLNPGSPTDRRRQPFRTFMTATA
ncbi:metallophosphoesterase family protein [Streptomyces sp. NPDC059918]|uniref:metallophosphoesterase family protein n=1 Tax=unclassified Streptomyces TaxID=2593676 RepID=UPI003650D029